MDTTDLFARVRAYLTEHQATALLLLGGLVVLAAWQVLPTNGLVTDGQQASVSEFDESAEPIIEAEGVMDEDSTDDDADSSAPSFIARAQAQGSGTNRGVRQDVDPLGVVVTGYDEAYIRDLWRQAFGRVYPFGGGFPFGTSAPDDDAGTDEESDGAGDVPATGDDANSGSTDDDTGSSDGSTGEDDTGGAITFPGGAGGNPDGDDGGTTRNPDTTAPVVVAVVPGSTSGTITLVAEATDPVVAGAETSGVSYVRFYVDDVFVRATSTAVGGTLYYVHIDSNEFSDGLHIYGAVAVDGAGNRSATSTRELQINNVPLPIDEEVVIEAVSRDALVVETDTDDIGTFTLTMDLTAVGADQYVSATTTSAFLYRVEGGAGETVATATEAAISATAPREGDSYRLTEGDTETFTLIVTLDPDVTDSYRVEFDALVVGDSADAPYGTSAVAAPDSDFETPYVYLEGRRTSEPEPVHPFVKGGVTLTLDDANLSQYTYIYSLMHSLGMVGTLYVPTGFIGDPTYMTWPQLVEMQDAGWDIGGHSVDHLELPTLTDEDERAEIEGSYDDLTTNGLDAQSFALPFGAYDVDTMANIAHTYDSNRHYHHQGLNAWPFNKYFLHVERIQNTTTLEEAKGWVDAAVAGDHWLIITLHEVIPGGDPQDETTWSTENLEALLHYMKDAGITPTTVADMLDQGPSLIPGGSFDTGLTNGWTTDAPGSITLDANGMGAYPEPEHSMALSSGDLPAHLFSNSFAVESGEEYGVRAYVDTRGLTFGEVGFYIDEYDADGNWISGTWLGQAGVNWVVDEVYTYTPTSAEAATAQLQVYITSRSEGTAYVDEIEIFN